MPIKTFLNEVESKLRSGLATEHSYRAALEKLFVAILPGSTVVNEPRHAAYGAPDFLIQHSHVPIGHVEAKDVGVDLSKIIADSERDAPKIANGKQLKRYRAALPNLLYTDGLVWHWFVDGTPRLEQPICLATWDSNKQKLQRHSAAAETLTTLLQQFAAHQIELVGTSHDLAQRLADIARWLDEVINTVLSTEETHGALHQQFEAFRLTLLPSIMHAEFADMYAQTLVYGLFAARVVNIDNPRFSRQDAAHAIPKTNPLLRRLFHQIAGLDLDDRIAWLVDDCARLLERTDMSEVLKDFGKATKQEDPILHFYETFLAAYDSKTREVRGVYYTPEPVVSYIVRSVDHLLQTVFHKPMGLADGDTVILDPATGTATFLHAVVQHISGTLQAMGMADAWNHYVPNNLLPRIYGFELLMAPYTIAHLKLSMLLQEFGYTFSSNERLGIYLTNALSDAPTGQHTLPFAQFIADEGRAANVVKHDKPVMVVLGNPPYSGHSVNKSRWIDNLLHGKLPDGSTTENYYAVDGKPLGERNPKWLQDDYVKFIRFAQWRIHQTGEGILAFISNNGYLDNPTFRGMRESLLKTFDTIYILNLHGNSKKKERAPDGSPDENVFDIQQGVAIGIFICRRAVACNGSTKNVACNGSTKNVACNGSTKNVACNGSTKNVARNGSTVSYADLWGKREEKYAMLNELDVKNTDWRAISPSTPWYLFVPQDTMRFPKYAQGWKITESMPIYSVGIVTGQDSKTIAFSHREAQALAQQHHLDTNTITNILYRPFDSRYIIYDSSIVTRPRQEVMQHLIIGENIGLITIRRSRHQGDWRYIFVAETLMSGATSLTSLDINYLMPLYIYPTNSNDMFASPQRQPNLSPAFISDIEQRLGVSFIPDGSGDLDTTIGTEDVFHYIYAMLHSPTYRSRYAEFLKIDFPRVPITSNNAVFKTLATKGAALVDLHLLRLPGSTGVGGAGGAAILSNPALQGLTQQGMTGATVENVRYDEQQQRVHISKDSFVAGVDPETWAMQIGGYQPLHKWLKDRKRRTLSFDDVLHYMRMVIALRETRRLVAEIDAVVVEWLVG